MKHIEPPENLPVVPEPPEPRPIEAAPGEDVHFRDPGTGDTVGAHPAEAAATLGDSAPAPRSLQPIRIDMTQRKERPIRVPDDLMSTDDVAERLLMSPYAVRRLVAARRLAVYRLPGGYRFKVTDVDAYLESRYSEVRPSKRYGAQEQG